MVDFGIHIFQTCYFDCNETFFAKAQSDRSED